jgi:hypothetical protein
MNPYAEWTDHNWFDQMVEHSEECLSKHRLQISAFSEKYPNYCRSCLGRGCFAYSYDPSPSGVALSPGRMIEMEPCRECEGSCPLCRHPLEDGETKCSECGWDFEAGPFYPAEPECDCWNKENSES